MSLTHADRSEKYSTAAKIYTMKFKSKFYIWVASYPGPSQLYNVAHWKAGGPGNWSLVHDVAPDRPSTDYRQATKGHPNWFTNFTQRTLTFSSAYLQITEMHAKKMPGNCFQGKIGIVQIVGSPTHKINVTWFWLLGLPTFQRATSKSWDGPGYEANIWMIQIIKNIKLQSLVTILFPEKT